MLLQKQKTMPYIHIFKLDTGEEIITKVIDDTISNFVIERPLQMGMGQQGLRFTPFMLMIDQDNPVKLYKAKIVSDAPPTLNIEAQYEQLTSNIALPQKSAIIT